VTYYFHVHTQKGGESVIIALDPGGTTGYVYWWPDGTYIGGQGDFDYMAELADAWFNMDIDAIVCERYTITAETLRKSRQTTALEMIGVAHFVALRKHADFVLQSPADAKRFSTDDRLDVVKWREPGQDHFNDACRHLMLYLCKNKLMEVPRAGSDD
jgi:hypothetical protein